MSTPLDPRRSATAEHARLAGGDRTRAWRSWGPYVAERAWGTVREDYSSGGDAWEYLPHDHARSRAYRWNEDGMAGLCDLDQTFCLALSLWNGRDPILKERFFGLANRQGNHGEDAKDCWWYLDSTPTHSFMRWRYHYPQAEFPYELLVRENAGRGRDQPEYELLDTGVFDDGRYWVVTVDYAKAAPEDLCVRIVVENRGPDEGTLEVLPTLWFRNTWAWDEPETERPAIRGEPGRLTAHHRSCGRLDLVGDGEPEPLLCDNETNAMRLYGQPGRSPFPKDGINDHVVGGAPTVNPERVGTKGALRYRLTVPGAGVAEVRLRLTRHTGGDAPTGTGADWERVLTDREREADEFYAALTPDGTDADRARILRQALAGLQWSKQFYHYDVDRWIDGDPAGPPPPKPRAKGRNTAWRHLDARDVILMPDPWEYPWFAAWDLAFHCVAMAHVDPAFAKDQLLLFCREWYMHPNGQLPAYEWNFGDVNPPVHAWAALRVFELDGGHDLQFLERVFHKLLINFTWWVNRTDAEGNNVFEGGFLGLDNIGAFDRSAVPVGHLEQSDGTAWMAMYCLSMLEIAMRLAVEDPTYEDVATKFFEHFAYISTAIVSVGLWDPGDQWFYDLLHTPDGGRRLLRVRSMVGVLPLCAVAELPGRVLDRLPDFRERVRGFLTHKAEYCRGMEFGHSAGGGMLLSVVDSDQLGPVLGRLFDEREFLSPYGLRSLSAAHREHPFELVLDGFAATVAYQPAESRTALFGGNSNWRGPVWFPLNVLLIEALRRYHRYLGDGHVVELPTGSGRRVTLARAADEIADRLVGLFCGQPDGSRPVFGDRSLLRDPGWRDHLWFFEYFHGDTGAGLGASHQTGWTALVAALIRGD